MNIAKNITTYMQPKKKRVTPQVSVRLGDELHARFDAACGKTRIDSSTVVRACLEAFCDEVEEKGGIWLPLRIVPDNTLEVARPEPRKKSA